MSQTFTMTHAKFENNASIILGKVEHQAPAAYASAQPRELSAPEQAGNASQVADAEVADVAVAVADADGPASGIINVIDATEEKDSGDVNDNNVGDDEPDLEEAARTYGFANAERSFLGLTFVESENQNEINSVSPQPPSSSEANVLLSEAYGGGSGGSTDLLSQLAPDSSAAINDTNKNGNKVVIDENTGNFGMDVEDPSDKDVFISGFKTLRPLNMAFGQTGYNWQPNPFGPSANFNNNNNNNNNNGGNGFGDFSGFSFNSDPHPPQYAFQTQEPHVFTFTWDDNNNNNNTNSNSNSNDNNGGFGFQWNNNNN